MNKRRIIYLICFILSLFTIFYVTTSCSKLIEYDFEYKNYVGTKYVSANNDILEFENERIVFISEGKKLSFEKFEKNYNRLLIKTIIDESDVNYAIYKIDSNKIYFTYNNMYYYLV